MLIAFRGYSQNSQTDEKETLDRADISINAQIALSNPDYQVTAGDIYTLAYAAGGTQVVYRITVDSSYRIRVSNLGIINAAGKTYQQLKREVETIVTNNYPLSGVQFVLLQPAQFTVYITGEVKAAYERNTWSLARLSSVADGNLTAFSSIRNISITAKNGPTKTYDLFKAHRDGDLSQDPYLRPGDTIVFSRVERVVTIGGAVERPGTYQLLSGEHIRELIEKYAHGFTPVADKTRMEMVRYVGGESISGGKIIFTETEMAESFPLYNYDAITINEITSLRPVMTVNRVERIINLAGAVRRPGTYNLMPEENLRDLIEIYGDGLTPLADASRIELVRYVGSNSVSGDKIILAENDILENFSLYNYDTITINEITSLRPVMTVNRVERIINLAGAVRRPGTYDLMPGENLRDLIEVYGDGLTPVADTSRMELVRVVDSESDVGDKMFLTGEDVENDFPLQNYDTITIPNIDDLQPVLFVEGAVGATEEAVLTASNRLVVPYNMGESYAALIRKNRSWFSAVSDTRNAYIIRGTEHIPINLNPMLYDINYRADYFIEENDTLIIPFRQYFVTVAGAVIMPGRYPYIPDRQWDYYIALAGGFNPEQNSMKSVSIADMAGKRLKKTDAITPETVITAKSNSFLYYFNQIAPVVTTVLTIFMTTWTLQATIGR
jgi:protein involved in polysaccharide export with SLBB domain